MPDELMNPQSLANQAPAVAAPTPNPVVPATKTVYLIKNNNDLCSECECDRAYVAFPPQMECPWCGCGWLFHCASCRQVFAFARAVEVDESWEELAQRDLAGFPEPVTDQHRQDWITAMQATLSRIEPGNRYVYLEGEIIAADAPGVHCDGWHARHDLDFVPQIAALDDLSVVENVLCNPSYWSTGLVGQKHP